jgi:O-acetyl-ADP-ribose deacetylase
MKENPLHIMRQKDRDLYLVCGDIAAAQTEGIVNAWNRNFIPHWLLIPQGVSKALKQRGGTGPFKELRRHGLLELGQAVATGAGDLPARYLIHAAALHAYWRASETSVELAARNSFALAVELGLKDLAIPLLGAGTGGLSAERSFCLIERVWYEFKDQGPQRTEIYVYDEKTFGEIEAGLMLMF